jgi:hypothetical protein
MLQAEKFRNPKCYGEKDPRKPQSNLFGLIVTEKAQLVGSRCGKLCLFVLFRGT